MSKQFNFKQFNLAQVYSLVLFDPQIGPYHVLPLRATEDLGSDGNEGVLCIPQSSSINVATASDNLVSYQDTHWGSLAPLQRCSRCNLQPLSLPTGQRSMEDSADLNWCVLVGVVEQMEWIYYLAILSFSLSLSLSLSPPFPSLSPSLSSLCLPFSSFSFLSFPPLSPLSLSLLSLSLSVSVSVSVSFSLHVLLFVLLLLKWKKSREILFWDILFRPTRICVELE